MFLTLLTAVTTTTDSVPAQSMEQGSSLLGFFLYIIVCAIIIYFLIFRPNKKRTQALVNLQNEIKIGDKITSFGGLIGIVKSIEQTTIIIEIAKGVEVEILKSSIIENQTQRTKI